MNKEEFEGWLDKVTMEQHKGLSWYTTNDERIMRLAWLEATRRQQEKIDRLKEILRQCHQTISELCPDMDIEYGDELKKLVGEK